jgi:hypothetical protein
MRQLLFAVLMLTTTLSACGWKHRVKDMSNEEYGRYTSLKVYMTEEQEKACLKKKTEEERSAYLKELGLWDRFYKYDEAQRKQIVDGKVEVGWTSDMVLMSWGLPYDKRMLPGRKAERSWMWVYRFEQQPDGSVMVWEKGSKTAYSAVKFFQREVILDDHVAELRDKNASW